MVTHSSGVKVALPFAISGSTTVVLKLDTLSAQAGLIPMVNGIGLPTSTLAMGSAAKDSEEDVSSCAAISLSSSSEPLTMTAARLSNAARRPLAKKSSIFGASSLTSSEAAAVASPSGNKTSASVIPLACQASKPASSSKNLSTPSALIPCSPHRSSTPWMQSRIS